MIPRDRTLRSRQQRQHSTAETDPQPIQNTGHLQTRPTHRGSNPSMKLVDTLIRTLIKIIFIIGVIGPPTLAVIAIATTA